MRGEEWREGGAHRAATKSLRQLRSAGFTGDDEDCRRQRQKGVEESGHYRASQLPLMVEDDGAEDDAPSSHQHDRGGKPGTARSTEGDGEVLGQGEGRAASA